MEIKDGKVKDIVERIHPLPRSKEFEDVRNNLKGLLPMVLWQGIFNHRCNNALQQLTGVICLDIEHPEQQYQFYSLIRQLPYNPYVLAFFTGPSGDGLKILFLTDLNDPRLYKNCYKHLEDRFETAYGIKPDSNCEALSQGCYLSWDPYLYVNPDAKVYHYEFDPTVEKVNSQSSGNHSSTWVPPVITPTQRFMNKMSQQVSPMSDEKIIEILDRRFQGYPENYKDGHRTKSIFYQAAKLCKAGIPEDKTADYLASRFIPTGYDARKLKNELHRAYEVSKDYFGCERGQYKPYSEYKKNHQ